MQCSSQEHQKSRQKRSKTTKNVSEQFWNLDPRRIKEKHRRQEHN
jgi:hypothetical protein